jgi:hypothetical protein
VLLLIYLGDGKNMPLEETIEVAVAARYAEVEAGRTLRVIDIEVELRMEGIRFETESAQ